MSLYKDSQASKGYLKFYTVKTCNTFFISNVYDLKNNVSYLSLTLQTLTFHARF